MAERERFAARLAERLGEDALVTGALNVGPIYVSTQVQYPDGSGVAVRITGVTSARHMPRYSVSDMGTASERAGSPDTTEWQERLARDGLELFSGCIIRSSPVLESDLCAAIYLVANASAELSRKP